MTAARLLSGSSTTDTTDPVVQTLLPRRDDRLLGKAVAIALALHVPLVFLSLPERTHEPAPIVTRPTLTIQRLRLKPPQPTPPELPPVRSPGTPKPFVVSTPPDEHGPVPEETPVEFGAFEPTVSDDVLAEPDAPPAPPGPLEIFAPGVTAPVLIPDCKVQPEYPELARTARLEGSVVLRAIVRADGSVGEVEVLSARPGGMGFEEAAIDAVLEWCYEPAMQHGRAVDVYFTIYVSFRLH